jgi:HAD superfamily phosphatase
MKSLLVFDMDGVLVDVTESYRETIAQTVSHFTGNRVTREQIQDYKNQGGWNDDWKLSHHIITQAGKDIPFETARDYFQSIFLGNTSNPSRDHTSNPSRGNTSNPSRDHTSNPSRDDASNPSRDREGAFSPPTGLILREQWVARPGVLEDLNRRFDFALFTGRPRTEAELTLNRFAGGVVFHPVIGMYDVQEHKPHPEGLLRFVKDNPGRSVYYIGDTVDDARCAHAAHVPFIGIAAPSNPRYLDLVFLFQESGAYAIIDDINVLPEVFAA